jgi:type IV pilus assembly protein PilX
MNNTTHLTRPRERGVVLIFTLIVLLILTIGGVALVRSMHGSLFSAGNLAFRADLANQGEQAVSNVLASVKAGTFVNPTINDNPAANYSSQMLLTNAQGIPMALLDTATFNAVGVSANDITGTGNVTIRYIVDRMCSGSGTSTNTLCVQSTAGPNSGVQPGNGLPPPTATVYRLSVRVSGPRSTQVFLQTSFTAPD